MTELTGAASLLFQTRSRLSAVPAASSVPVPATAADVTPAGAVRLRACCPLAKFDTCTFLSALAVRTRLLSPDRPTVVTASPWLATAREATGGTAQNFSAPSSPALYRTLLAGLKVSALTGPA